jgi:LacI family transcriptional regulator
LLRLPLGDPIGREALRGVNRYVKVHGPWRLLLYTASQPMAEVLSAYPDADGAIAIAWDPVTYRELSRWGRPVALVTGRDSPPGLPRVLDDDEGICRAAFEHLQSRGHDRFAFVSPGEAAVFERRKRLFSGLVRGSGAELIVHDLGPAGGAGRLERRRAREASLAEWVAGVPKPLGVFAAYGTEARDLLDAALQAGVNVPEELAVVGAGYDELLAESCSPTLTTVDEDWEEMGYRAAGLVRRMLAGESLRDMVVTVPCRGVTLRGSTDQLAIDDPAIARAVRLVRHNACEDVSIDEMLAGVGVSRRTVEMGFRKYLKRTIHDEIIRVRIQRAKQMLRLSDLAVIEIGMRCGFSSRSRFYECFREATGFSPQQYRSEAEGAD